MYHFTVVALYLLGGVMASPLSRQRICWKNEQRILKTTACFKTFIAVLLFSIKWLRQPVFNCESSLLQVTSFNLFNHLEVSTLSPTCLYMTDQFKYFNFIPHVWQYIRVQVTVNSRLACGHPALCGTSLLRTKSRSGGKSFWGLTGNNSRYIRL